MLPQLFVQPFSTLSLNGLMGFLAQQQVPFIASEILIALTLLFCLVLSMSQQAERHQQSWMLSLVGSSCALLSLIVQITSSFLANPQASYTVLFGMFQADLFSCLVRAFILTGFILILLMSKNTLRQLAPHTGAEFLVLLLTALLGALSLTGAVDLVMIFVSLETLGIASYVMTGLLRNNVQSAEAALKYLIYGAASSSVFLFGLALLYGVMGGSTYLPNLPGAMASMVPVLKQAIPFMLVMLTAGVGFKLAAAPFHLWAPDVYEGSPTPVTAFLSIVSKLAGFALAMRLVSLLSASTLGEPLFWLLGGISVISMVWGNVVALWQTSLKRLLAYSTIAHAGYVLLGLVLLSDRSLASVWFYLLSYVFMNLGAFACAIQGEHWLGGSDKIADYAGLVRKKPLYVFAFSVFLMSLAGMPITAGFFAKFFLFQSVSLIDPIMLYLVGAGLLASVVSLAYYLNVLRVLILEPPSPAVEAMPVEPGFKLRMNTTGLSIAITLIGTLALGFAAPGLYSLCQQAVASYAPASSGPYLSQR